MFSFIYRCGPFLTNFQNDAAFRHTLEDEDVVQIVAKTAEEQRQDKNYGQKVQAFYDQWHAAKKKKAKLKT